MSMLKRCGIVDYDRGEGGADPSYGGGRDDRTGATRTLALNSRVRDGESGVYMPRWLALDVASLRAEKRLEKEAAAVVAAARAAEERGEVPRGYGNERSQGVELNIGEDGAPSDDGNGFFTPEAMRHLEQAKMHLDAIAQEVNSCLQSVAEVKALEAERREFDLRDPRDLRNAYDHERMQMELGVGERVRSADECLRIGLGMVNGPWVGGETHPLRRAVQEDGRGVYTAALKLSEAVLESRGATLGVGFLVAVLLPSLLAFAWLGWKRYTEPRGMHRAAGNGEGRRGGGGGGGGGGGTQTEARGGKAGDDGDQREVRGRSGTVKSKTM